MTRKRVWVIGNWVFWTPTYRNYKWLYPSSSSSYFATDGQSASTSADACLSNCYQGLSTSFIISQYPWISLLLLIWNWKLRYSLHSVISAVKFDRLLKANLFLSWGKHINRNEALPSANEPSILDLCQISTFQDFYWTGLMLTARLRSSIAGTVEKRFLLIS
jgi:hypothetical protein